MLLLYTTLLIQAFYWLYFFRHLAKAGRGCGEKREGVELPPLSIIVCAHNEAEVLAENIPYWLRQRYPADWELLIVDDHSTDETASVCLRQQAGQGQGGALRLLTLEGPKPAGSGKKQALAAGIENAKYDCFLLTDADCRPASDFWAACMAEPLAEGRDLVLGYSPFEKRKGLLNVFQRFEGLWTAMQYLSFAERRMAYMGVGRNMAYTRKLYRETGGFEAHGDLPYGDDDLFVQQAVRSGNYTVCLRPESFVWTVAPPTLKAWLQQKRRHLSAARKYKFRDQVLLGLFSLSLVLQLGGAYVLLPFFPLEAGAVLLLRYLFVLPIAARLCRRLSQPDLWKLWPLLEFLLLFYLLLFSPVAMGWVRLKKWRV